MNDFVCFNGEMQRIEQPLFFATNRGFKYGDGVFETARMSDGKLLLQEFHFERVLKSLQLLQIVPAFNFTEKLLNEVEQLSKKNGCSAAAKIRLAVFRGADNCAEYLLEATSLSPGVYQWNETGFTIEVHPLIQKSCDAFSNLKSANYLPYIIAAKGAEKACVDECLVLNSKGFIADGSKTNLFVVKDETVYTPALSEGCVQGVMRRFVLEKLSEKGNKVMETSVPVELLAAADEVFLTNAIQGIIWVRSFRGKQYRHPFAKTLFTTILQPLLH